MELRCGYVNGDLSNCIYIEHCYDSPGGGSGGGDGGWGGGGSGGNVDDTPELQQFEQNYKAQMSQAELAIYNSMTRVQQISYLLNAQRAVNIAEARYPTSLHNGNGDAFRHAFFSELNAATLGVALAKQLGDAHEQQSSSALETQMDLFNNEQGRQVSFDLPGASYCRFINIRKATYYCQRHSSPFLLNIIHYFNDYARQSLQYIR